MDTREVQSGRRPALKLYVWTDVLRDYTPGMAVALARTKREALAAIAAAGVLTSHSVDELLGDESED